MSYFSERQHTLRLYSTQNGGLRQCQIGASCAIGAHMDRRKDPCRVVLPTGAGKTTLMIIAALQKPAERILIITPTVAVRDQIAEEYRTLKTVKEQGAIGADVVPPKVFVQTSYLRTPEEWKMLLDYDVVIATPRVVSSHLQEVSNPPSDLFDLVFIDEAHHSAAPTYQQILEDFQQSAIILLTATPYRSDGKFVPGVGIYSYSLAEALEHDILTPMKFMPVRRQDGETEDKALCRTISEHYKRDKARGQNYRIMVRASTIKRSIDIKRIYDEESPDIKLQRIDHRTPYRKVQEALQFLREGKLDGIIAVDMFGEGFDFPDLKACALHSPHDSLTTTIQFLGRFARTRKIANDEAVFFALPSDNLSSEARELFDKDADWLTLVPNLADAAGEAVLAVEKMAAETTLAYTKQDAKPFMWYNLEFPHHARVFLCHPSNIAAVQLPNPQRTETLRAWANASTGWSLSVFERLMSPEWMQTNALTELSYDFTLASIYQVDSQTSLLFIASSHRSEAYFRTVAKALVGSSFRTPPMHVLSRLLNDIQNLQFPNFGKRRQDARASGESYATIAGRSPQKTITPLDSSKYKRGHVFATGIRDRKPVGIGFSPGGTIWNTEESDMLTFLSWCGIQAKYLKSSSASKTGTPIDHLKFGKPLEPWNSPIIYMDWNNQTKWEHEKICLVGNDANYSSLYETTIQCIREDSQHCIFEFEIEALGMKTTYAFDLQNSDWFSYTGTGTEPFEIGSKKNKVLLTEFMLEHPPKTVLLDGAEIEGDSIYEFELTQNADLPPDFAQSIDWGSKNVNIQNEFGLPFNESLHGYLEDTYKSSNILFYDHSSYEAADYIEITEEKDGPICISFFHCKASSDQNPGQRQNDLQEVLRQAFVSLRYVDNPHILRLHISKRMNAQRVFKAGNFQELERLLDLIPIRNWKKIIYLVQPGLTRDFSPEIKRFLLHAQDAFAREDCELRLICS